MGFFSVDLNCHGEFFLVGFHLFPFGFLIPHGIIKGLGHPPTFPTVTSRSGIDRGSTHIVYPPELGESFRPVSEQYHDPSSPNERTGRLENPLLEPGIRKSEGGIPIVLFKACALPDRHSYRMDVP